MLFGDNGLIGKAKQAVEKYEEAQQGEGESLKDLEDDLKSTLKEAGAEVDAPHNVNWDTNKVTPTSDGKGNVIPVPKGFYYAGGDKNTGFVISDVSGDDLNNSKQGNQFVWIPCTDTQYEDAKNDIIEFDWSRNKEYNDNGDDSHTGDINGEGTGADWSDDYDSADISNIIGKYGADAKDTITTITSNWENNQTTVAKGSLKTYGGFYIARYEAGIPSTATTFYTSSNGGAYNITNRGQTNNAGLEIVKNLLPVSKKGVQAWNFITQPNSKIVAENMYKEGKTSNSEASKSVGSYLVDNPAWNVICNRFNDILGTSEEGRTITNSTKLGNYYNNTTTDYTKINGLWALHGYVNNAYDCATTYKKGSVNVNPNGEYTKADGTKVVNRIELATGLSDDFKVYNIYDMAGNMWEWTTGHNIKVTDTTYKTERMGVVARGGSFLFAGSGDPVVRASGLYILTTYGLHVGFRVVLYVK